MSTKLELMDPSLLTVEQLTELLNKKISSPTKIISDVSPKVDEEKSLKCAFKPTRANQTVCDEKADIFFGSLGYCSRHRRSVQALNARKNNEEANKEKLLISSPKIEEPPVAPVPVTPVAQTETKIISSNKKNKDAKVSKKTPPPVDEISSPQESKNKNSPAISETKISKEQPMVPVAKQTSSVPPPKNVIKKKITPNTWGRFEDPDTGIVFDPKTKMAYGVQDHTTGKILSLSKKHIDLCKKYKWKYHVLPEASKEIEMCEDCGYQKEECECFEEDEENDVKDEEGEEEEDEGEGEGEEDANEDDVEEEDDEEKEDDVEDEEDDENANEEDENEENDANEEDEEDDENEEEDGEDE